MSRGLALHSGGSLSGASASVAGQLQTFRCAPESFTRMGGKILSGIVVFQLRLGSGAGFKELIFQGCFFFLNVS